MFQNECLPKGTDSDPSPGRVGEPRSAWHTAAACPTAPGVDSQPRSTPLVIGLSCLHRGAPRVRLLGAKRCPLGPPSDKGLGPLEGKEQRRLTILQVQLLRD